jgi:hypothetical protein
MLHLIVAGGDIVFEALYCMPEGIGFETRWGEWNPAALASEVYSASNKNWYKNQKSNVPGEHSGGWSVRLTHLPSAVIRLSVPGSRPDDVNVFINVHNTSSCVGLITLLASVSRLSRQCGILNISQPYGPPQPVTEIALLIYIWCRLLVGKPEGKRPLGRPRRRWIDNIKMDLLKTGVNVVDWIGLAQDRYRWRALVKSVMNLRVP